jgi:hypothetical protein
VNQLKFVTFFDINYFDKGKVLYDSLCQHVLNFELFVVCLDNRTSEILLESNYPNLTVVNLDEIEKKYVELEVAKSNRSLVEYYFTLSPFCPRFCMEKFGLKSICSLDADIQFYSSPVKYFDQLENHSIVLTPHKFSSNNKDKIKYGIYNVSFQIFKNDPIGNLCLKKWSMDCLEWCKDYFDEKKNRFADQLYLNNWLQEYKGSIYIINDDVGGIAPWNLNNYKLTLKKGRFFSNDKPLIFFHFHDFRIVQNNYIFHSFQNYGVDCDKGITALYKDYFMKVTCGKIKNLQFNSARYNRDGLFKRVARGEYFFLNTIYFGLWHMDDSRLKLKLRNLLLRKWRN